MSRPHDTDRQPTPNRATRRADRRRLLASLRDSGCRCTPTITADRTPDPNARETGTISHAAACPLNLRLALASLSGRQPMLVVDGARECER